MSREEIDRFLRDFDKKSPVDAGINDIHEYMRGMTQQFMGSLGSPGQHALTSGQGDSNAIAPISQAQPIQFNPAQIFQRATQFMQEQFKQSQEMFEQAMKHMGQSMQNGGKNGSPFYYNAQKSVSLPNGLQESQTMTRTNNGEEKQHVRQINDKKVVESYSKNYQTGQEDKNRQLYNVKEDEVDNFYQTFSEKYGELNKAARLTQSSDTKSLK